MKQFFEEILPFVKVEKLRGDMPLHTFRSKRRRGSFTEIERLKYLDNFNEVLKKLKESEIKERNNKELK